MKLTLTQLMVVLVFSSMSIAYDGRSQEFLNKTVSISLEDAKLRSVLSSIEKQASVKFVYSSKAIRADRKVTMKTKELKLSEFLLQELSPLHIGYRILEGQIILNPISETLTIPAKVEKVVENLNVEQTTTITGTVTDENGVGLPGVSILVKGTVQGSNSNNSGNYSIVVPNDKVVLIFSFVGYVKQEILISNRTVINVALATDNMSLDEVVVVGYGTQKKSDVISSVATIKPDRMTKMATLDVGEMLRGKAAGVFVTTSDAGPGGSSNIQVRGRGSINGGTNPYILADGIPIGSINDINPADIESVEVLKDASAQAIYGARASNGVILITTKRGKSGALKINYDSYYGIQNAKRNFDVYNGSEFAALKREADRAVNLGVLRTDNLIFSASELEAIAANRSIDWTGEVFKNAAIHNHNLSIATGTEKTKLYVGLNYQNMTGIVPNTNIQKGTLRVNFDQTITSWLKIGANTSFQLSGSSDPDVAGNVRLAVTASPLGNIYNPDGSYNVRPGGNQESFNPLLDLYENTKNKNSRNDILNIFVDVSPFKGFNYRLNASRRSWNYKELNYATQKSSSGVSNGTGSGSINFQENAQWQIENILTYDFSSRKNHFNVTAVGSVNQNDAYNFTNAATAVPNDILGIYGLVSALKNVPTIGGNQRRLVSGVGRLQYDYDSKYYLTLSARADGSSVFGANNKWGYFPAVAVGWNISKENFFNGLTFVDNLKLRGSYGSVGNEGIDPYGSLSLANQVDYLFGTEKVSGFLPGSSLPNPSLKWETSTTLNTAVDFGFLKNRISGTIEYYKTNTTDLLVNRQLNAAIGYTSIRDNIGEVQNTGIEIQLDLVPIRTTDLTVKTGFLFSKNKNKILRLYGDLNSDGVQDDDVANRWFIGQPISVFYQPKFIGIWQAKDKTDGLIDANTRKLAVPGDVRLEDVNNDGKIDSQDNYITSRFQDWIGSFNLSVNYKNVDFSADVYTVQGVMRDNVFLYDYTYGGDLRGNRNGIKVDYWTPENPSNTYPRPNAGNSPLGMNFIGLQDASFWRLQNVTLGYSLPTTLVSKIKLSRLRVYATAQNLLTITKYQSYSPEQDASAYPTTRNFIAGIQIGF